MTPPFLTSTVDGSGQLHAPDRFIPEETVPPARQMGPRIGLEFMERRKISFRCRESNPDSSVVYLVA
jgi:hypothetical protein